MVPLSQQTIGVKLHDGEVRGLFVDLDTLLYQWQRGSLPNGEKSPGAYVSEKMGWPRPLSDLEMVTLANHCEAFKQKTEEDQKTEILGKIGNQVNATQGEYQQAQRLLQEAENRVESRQDIDPANHSPGQLPAPDLLDVALMVAFILRIDPDLESWGLERLRLAGCSQAELRWAAERCIVTRRR